MKTIIFSLFLLNTAFASEDVLLSKCLKPAKRYYYQHAGPSDVARNFSKLQALKANEALKYGDRIIVTYEYDKLIYSGSGSYYSGYFIDYVVVNPIDCSVEQIINVYSE